MNITAPMKARLRTDSGQTLVEFAIAAMVFLLLVFSVIDFSYFFFVKLTLQNAVRQGGRYAITGQAIAGKNRYASILQTVENQSLGLATSSNTTICSAVGGCSSGGGPGDTITVTVAYTYKFITPLVAAFFKDGAYTVQCKRQFQERTLSTKPNLRRRTNMTALRKDTMSEDSGSGACRASDVGLPVAHSSTWRHRYRTCHLLRPGNKEPDRGRLKYGLPWNTPFRKPPKP